MDSETPESDIKTQTARLAAALIAALESGRDTLPDLPVGRRTRTAATQPSRSRTTGGLDASPARPAPQPQAPDEPPLVLPDNLAALREVVAACERCRLARTRKTTVFGEGPSNPLLMVVGEGAGEAEEGCGRPFSGEAGKLLTNILKAMGLDREKDCYVTTVLKCRVPDDSTPTPDLVGRCRPYLTRQIELINPRCVMAMGQTAASVLAGSPSITRLRGKVLKAGDKPLLVTYHPATLLKDPTLKKLVWQDVQVLMPLIKSEDPK